MEQSSFFSCELKKKCYSCTTIMQDYSQPTTTHKTQRSIGFVYIIPLGLTVGFFIFGLIFVLRGNNVSLPGSAAKPTPTAQVAVQATKAPTEAPTPTSTEASVKKDDIVISVLNGSGIGGAAAKAASVLKTAGFSEVTTGNTDDAPSSNVTIRHTKAAKAAAALVESALKKDYTIDSLEEADLTGKTQVEVVIGKAKTSSRPTPTETEDEG